MVFCSWSVLKSMEQCWWSARESSGGRRQQPGEEEERTRECDETVRTSVQERLSFARFARKSWTHHVLHQYQASHSTRQHTANLVRHIHAVLGVAVVDDPTPPGHEITKINFEHRIANVSDDWRDATLARAARP